MAIYDLTYKLSFPRIRGITNYLRTNEQHYSDFKKSKRTTAPY